ncbi:unnamed protein product [Prunus armeniaca]|uniref:laccase n=1 Tax=Prunus armeniaca TaxID=36596 RepID=A0A6J5Y7M5_PRUAR|nr:unnamed protein product [Prunus armeniaca]
MHFAMPSIEKSFTLLGTLQSTLYGAIVILPKQGAGFPFPQPYKEANIVIGEWWNNDVKEVVKQGNKLGLPSNMSDAHPINDGKPGPLFPCSEKRTAFCRKVVAYNKFIQCTWWTYTYALEVEQGKTYLLRIINAALNDEQFFAIAGHNLTVVETDAVYTKPFTSQAILIAPGQTTNILVQAKQAPDRYFMAARPFMDTPVSIDNKTATRILQYKGIPNTVQPVLLQLPAINNTVFALSFNAKLSSLNTARFPASVPLKFDQRLFYTIRLGINQCMTCLNGTQLTASLNNITFVMPQIGLLQAHNFNTKGVITTDFPDRPLTPFNYTGAPITANLGTKLGTRLSKLAFNSTVELESHPFDLHGYNFFVVGTGVGNFDPKKDPAKYNFGGSSRKKHNRSSYQWLGCHKVQG